MSRVIEKKKAGEQMKGGGRGFRKISGCFLRGVTLVAVSLQVLILVPRARGLFCERAKENSTQNNVVKS